MRATAASGGAAGGAKQVANVPGQQYLERFDGVGGRELLEQVAQVRGEIQVIGAGDVDQGKEICTVAGTEGIVREEPYPASLGKGPDDVLHIVVVYRHISVLQVQHQLLSLVVRIEERFAKRALRGRCGQEALDRLVECGEDRCGFFLATLDDLLRRQRTTVRRVNQDENRATIRMKGLFRRGGSRA